MRILVLQLGLAALLLIATSALAFGVGHVGGGARKGGGTVFTLIDEVSGATLTDETNGNILVAE